MTTARSRKLIAAALDGTIGFTIVATLLAGSAFTASSDQGVPTSKRRAAAEWSEDGLQKIDVKGLDLVYARPAASLAGYTKVMLKPVSVAFRRDWGRGTTIGARVRSDDAQRIKDRLAVLVREQVVSELAKGGYPVVESAGDEVLEVGMSIDELYITAPDVPTMGRANTYALSVGEMTLVAELRDSASGDIIARIHDRAVGRESGRMQIITSVDNVAEARSAAGAWARALRNALDRARRIGSKRQEPPQEGN